MPRDTTGNKTHSRDDIKLMHLKFLEAYADPKSPTYGQVTASYFQAGYKQTKSAPQSASRLLNSDKIQALLKEYKPEKPAELLKKIEISKDYALACLQETWDTAKKQCDTTNMVACVRLMMQKNNLLSDRLVVSTEDAIEMEESYARQYKQIASIILNNKELLPEQSTPLPIKKQVKAHITDTQFEEDDVITVDAATG